jgi:capsular exopolysaccharide synthesis family protein
VVLTSSVSGEGKTLTGLNLALCCAQLHDLRVLLIDGDLCTRGLTGLLGNPPAPGLSEVLAGSAQPEQAIIATDLPNLHILGAGAPTVPSLELYASNRWKELVGWCGENFKLVLVDSPPILPLADFELMSAACDGVLLIVRALQTSRELLRKAAGAVDKKKFLGVVFNGADFNGQGSYSDRSGYSNSDVPK